MLISRCTFEEEQKISDFLISRFEKEIRYIQGQPCPTDVYTPDTVKQAIRETVKTFLKGIICFIKYFLIV